MSSNEETLALDAIRKKLIGKKLHYKEIYAIMDEIAHHRFSDILTTYFAASGYSNGFSHEEIYYLTKAMIETGDTLHFKGIVADKHCIGGVPGTRTTLIVIPIVAAAGFIIPKSSSRAITTPGGTADDMEVLAPVSLSKEKIYEVVEKTNGCIVWGGSVNIAPADDVLIQVEKPLQFESFDKIIVSIMAKKIAFSSNHVIIDIPYGDMVKVHTAADAKILKDKFETLAEKFHIKLYAWTHKTDEPAGRGIGPLLETRESIKVLEQKSERPLDLEEKALTLAGKLLDSCLEDSHKQLQEKIKQEFGNGYMWAKYILSTKHAHKKMLEIIKAQGGNPEITSTHLKPGKFHFTLNASKKGTVHTINSKNITIIAKILGAPDQKSAGMYLHKKIGEKLEEAEPVYTLYAESQYLLQEAKESLASFPIFEYN